MVKLELINSEQTYRYIGFLRVNVVKVTIPDLENYGIKRESILNFQTRLFSEIFCLFFITLYDNVEIIKEQESYTYEFKVDDIYCYYKKFKYLNDLVNNLLKEFPFVYHTKKRKVLHDEQIVKKIQKLNIE